MKLKKNSEKVNETKKDVPKTTNPKSTFWSSDRDTTVPVNIKKSKPVIVIAGDSMVKNINGWMLSRAENVKVHSFSGADSNNMMDFSKPVFRKNPTRIILHYGTNDLGRHILQKKQSTTLRTL